MCLRGMPAGNLLAWSSRRLSGAGGWCAATTQAGQKTATISVPTLIADGTIDQLGPAANDYALAQLIGGARLKLYPDAGHVFLFQDEKAFVPPIESFLR